MTAKATVQKLNTVPVYMTGTKLDTAAAVYRFLKHLFPALSPVKTAAYLQIVLKEDEAGMIDGCRDLDAIQGYRYKDLGIASAFEAFIVNEEGSGTSELVVLDEKAAVDKMLAKRLVSHPEPGVMELCEMLGSNNGMGRERGGYLKDRARFPYAFAWFIRMASDIAVPGLERLEDRLRHWIIRLMPVFETYYAFHRKAEQEPQKHEALDFKGFVHCFPRIVKDLRITEETFAEPESLLTLPGYLVARFSTMREDEMMGGAFATIEAEYLFWRAAFIDADNVEESGRVEALRLVRESRAFNTPAGPALSITTDNPHAARYLWKADGGADGKVVLILIRKTDGHAVIQTRKGAPISLDEVFKDLEEMEPGLWHYERRLDAAMAMNGSGVVLDVHPSLLPTSEIEALIGEKLRLTHLSHRRA